MKRILLAVAILMLVQFSQSAHANGTIKQRADSLSRELAHVRGTRTADLYLQLAHLTADSMPALSFRYVEQALIVSIRLNYLPGKAESHYLMGSYFRFKRKYTLALENYLTALRLFRMVDNAKGQMLVYDAIGVMNRDSKNYETAISYFQQGLTVSRLKMDPGAAGEFLKKIGICYQLQGAYSLAMVLYEQAMESYRKAGSKSGEVSVYNCIGSVMMDQKKYDEALTYFQNLIPKALPADRYFVGTVYTRISHIYYSKKDYQKALEYNRMALKARIHANLPEDIASSLINIGGDFYMLDQPDSAWKYLSTGLNQAYRLNRASLVENGYKHIYEYWLRKGDYVKAVNFYRRFSAVGDSIVIDRNKGNIALIEANQKILRIGETNALLAKQNQLRSLNVRNQRFQVGFIQILTFFAGLLVVTFLIRYLFILYSRKKMQRLNVTLSNQIKEREKVQYQLGQRERQYRFLAEHSIDMITRIDKNFSYTYASPSSLRVLGFTPDEMLGKTPYSLTHTDYLGYTESVVNEMVMTRTAKQMIYQACKKDGSYTWAESVINPIFDSVTGEFKEFVAVTRDIQDRKIKELEIMEGTKQKENLLKEIHHRVKNNFAILVSLINMQKDQTKNPELLQSLTNLQLRIRTMALVHEMLYRSKDFERISFPDYLRSVASVIAGTFNRRDIGLVFELDEATMDIEASIPLGLMINEILSNAFKHAIPAGREGVIRVVLKNDPDSPNLFLSIADDGIGMPEGFSIENCKSMGLQIVQILVKQIEGQLTITGNGGTCFAISFPKAV